MYLFKCYGNPLARRKPMVRVALRVGVIIWRPFLRRTLCLRVLDLMTFKGILEV